jgi:predicted glycoside hydrolase/deacetylase ChbG (UPF0249 family)
MKRSLIVNADDFGQSPGVNRGIVAAYERGIVTSASLMVRWPAAAEAAAYGRLHPDLSVGLHLDLGEWIFRDETWVRLYEVVAIEDGAAVADEVTAQLDAFRRHMGNNPTHLDSHQHVHMREPVRSIVHAMAHRIGVPLRGCTPEVRHCGEFYGQTAEGTPFPEGISVTRLQGLLAALPSGFTELGCHPAQGDDLRTMYRQERAHEVEVLCDSRVREALADAGIALCSFHAVSEQGFRVHKPMVAGLCRGRNMAPIECEA